MPEPEVPKEIPPINEKTPSAADLFARVTLRERLHRRWIMLLGVLPTTAGLFLLAYVYFTRNVPELPMNARLTVQAWTALNAKKWDEAIISADECIGRFNRIAETSEFQLTQQSVPLPPIGAVSDDLKTAISSRGPLNDVATCFFIKGRAEESLGKNTVAREAYEAALRYPHARCWDPNGWFWSPAVAAQERIKQLPKP